MLGLALAKELHQFAQFKSTINEAQDIQPAVEAFVSAKVCIVTIAAVGSPGAFCNHSWTGGMQSTHASPSSLA
jgi:hypothetical protein